VGTVVTALKRAKSFHAAPKPPKATALKRRQNCQRSSASIEAASLPW
jgi:hypothetical protein